jgi:hypothetical protein
MAIFQFFETLLIMPLILLPLQFLVPSEVKNIKKRVVLGSISVLGFLLIILHIIVEGLRWQLIPIYIPAFISYSAGIILLVKEYRTKSSEPSEPLEPKEIITRGNILSVGALVFILVLVFSSVFINTKFPLFNLPPTTGFFKVGTTTFQLIDTSREETFTEDLTDTRKFMIRVWYPATVTGNPRPVPYVESPSEFGTGVQRSFGFPSVVVSHLALIPTHSYRDAPLLEEISALFPILIYSHGYGGLDFQNTVLLEELASHGFIIFSINHVYESTVAVFPDGSTIYETDHEESYQINESLEIWTQDTQFLIDQLEITNNDNIPSIFWNRLDINRIGLFGHSFGGTTAEDIILVDPRVNVGISMDCPHIGNSLTLNITKPFMLMFGEDYGNSELNDTVYLRAENATYGLFIDGAKHYNFADVNIWAPFLKDIGYIGSIDGYRMLNIINAYILSFFNEYLRGIHSTLLDGPSLDYPEVHFYSRGT